MHTTNLELPYIAAAQAQKHVTHNEALRQLDIIVQLSVADRDLSSPPPDPEDGTRYIVNVPGSGAWLGHDGQVAVWQDGAWAFYAPKTGWLAWVVDEGQIVVWEGGQWSSFSASSGDPGGGEPIEIFGVNTTADATNRLAVKSDAVLVSHDDVTPGTGDARILVNKALAAQTGSLLFQTGYGGRAELGLTGDDDFHLKVSLDGTNWNEAVVTDRSSGAVTFPKSTRVTTTVHTSGSGTYTPPAGCIGLVVTAIGGGGGGSGAEITSSSVYAGTGGGGAGAMVIKYISQPSGNYSYSVGVGGAGGSAASGAAVGSRNGGAGTATTFSGTSVSISSGAGEGAVERTPVSGATEFNGGEGGLATGGDLNIDGARGFGGVTTGPSGPQVGAGFGANTPYGVGGAVRNGDGLPGSGYGSGGAGAGMIPGYSGSLNRAGGSGANGLLIIEEFN